MKAKKIKQIIEIIENSSYKYWDEFPSECITSAEDDTPEGRCIDRLNKAAANKIYKLLSAS